MAFDGQDDRADQEQHAVAGVAQDHGEEQREKCQEPEGNIVFAVARYDAQNIENRDHQPGDLVVADLGGDQFILVRRIVHGPGPAVFSGGGLELVHIVGGDVAGEPYQTALGGGGVPDRGVLHGVLGLEDLGLEAGNVGRRLFQQRLAVRHLLIQGRDFPLDLGEALVGHGELVGGDALGQGTPQGHGL